MTQTDQELTERCEQIAEECVGFNVRRLTRAVSSKYAEAFAGTGLESTQFSLLVACQLAGQVPMTLLADAIRMDRTTLARNLAPLERQGLVTVSPGKDRRVKIVEITENGRKKLDSCLDAWSHAHRNIIGLFGEQRLKLLIENMRDLEGRLAS